MTEAPALPVDTYSFAAMGTVGTLQFPGADARGEQIAKIVRGLEAKWSRFLPDSEISVLNRHPGAFMAVSPETWDLLVGARYWQRATGGLFDVAYVGASGGETIRPNPELNLGESVGGAVEESSGFYFRRGNIDAAVSREHGLILHSGMACVGAGRQLDLGGIGKGVAADLALQSCLDFCKAARGENESGGTSAAAGSGVVAGEASKAGASGGDSRFDSESRIMVNLGSSSLAFRADENEPWRIGIRSPWVGTPSPVGYLELCNGSVSLSGTAQELEPGLDWVTHLVNPLTGQPAQSNVALAVVVAKDGITAEAVSTAVLLLGSQAGLDLCVAHHVAAAVFTCDRQVLGTPDMVKFLRLGKPGLSASR
ncbi:FAD:protein FMN transferase [Mobiluncus mulieris]|uniref:FAD:protein FMN transferase n=1 Tax=Mobiluncus mulieris TaxID=2052 RepID=A0A7Y0U2Y9_9ACTO|nr:FAD:protein FMN transferase [Mobiluncus mulieris]